MSFEFSVAEIAKVSGGNLLAESEVNKIGSFSIDTRTIKKGDCFLALKGSRLNGHDFIPEALAKGCCGVIFQDEIDYQSFKNKKAFFLKVKDINKSISLLAKYKRLKFNFPILAISGSNGKTTVKELAAEFLGKRYLTYKNILNQNNILGLSLNILNCSSGYGFGVFEIGISQNNEMDILLGILKPNHALITNISSSHTEFLKDETGVFLEKIKLFKFLDDFSLGFYSLDEKFFNNLKIEDFKCRNFKTFGFKKENDYFVCIKSISLDGIEFSISDKLKVRSNLLGKHSAYNIAAAVAVALAFGVDEEDILDVLSCYKSQVMRMNHFSLPGFDIIDDSCNSNPASLKSVLEFISNINYEGIKIAVLGDMLELGEKSKEFHRDAGYEAAGLDIDYFFCYGDWMSFFTQALKEKNIPQNKFLYSSLENIQNELLSSLEYNKKTLLLFKASRKMRADLILNKVKEEALARYAL